MIVTSSDWIPKYEYYGITQIITNLLSDQIEFDSFVEQVNIQADKQQKGLMSLTSDMMNLLISDLYSAGKLRQIRFDGRPPESVQLSRGNAPADLGQDDTTIWFGTPDNGNSVVMWYVDGVLRLSEERNLATNRSVVKGDIGALVGDVVQIAYLTNDLVSWWAGIEID